MSWRDRDSTGASRFCGEALQMGDGAVRARSHANREISGRERSSIHRDRTVSGTIRM
jgi:hypothetical protein